MDAVRYAYNADWGGGVFTNMVLDTVVSLSPWNHPALACALSIDHTITILGPRLLSGSPTPTYTGIMPPDARYPLPTFGVSNTQGAGSAAWSAVLGLFALTTQAGDALTFTTTAQRIDIRLVGQTASGQGLVSGGGASAAQIRNGGIVQVLVDTQVREVVDTWGRNPVVTLYLLDGLSHTISLVHSGTHNPAVRAITAPQPLVSTLGTGNTLQEGLTCQSRDGTSLVPALWRALAVPPSGGGTQVLYTIYRTDPGSSEVLQSANLVPGVHYVGVVPGADLYMDPSVPLAPGDSVTWTTDPVQVGIQNVVLGWGDTSGAASYTSATIDSGRSDTQWFLAEWFTNVPWGSFSLQTGNDAVGGTIAWAAPYSVAAPGFAPLDPQTDLPGTAMALAGLLAAPRGRYARWTLAAPAAATALPYARDLALYYWQPEHDLVMVHKLPLGAQIGLGPQLEALVGTLEVFLAKTYADSLRREAGATVAGATDEYLLLWGEDLGLPPYLPGEPPEAYRARLGGALASCSGGASLPFIAHQLALLIFGTTQLPVVDTPSPLGAAGATCGELPPAGASPSVAFSPRIVHVRQDPALPSQSYLVEMPALPYQGLPGVSPATIKSMVQRYLTDVLTPAGAVIDLLDTSFHIVWPF